MKAISGKDFSKLLERKGWMLRRINGSHHIYSKEVNPDRISLPISTYSSQHTLEAWATKTSHENRRN